MKKSTKIISSIALIVLIVSVAVKIWMGYSRRVLDLEMDMCDTDGHVIHVTIDAILRRGLGEPWEFHGEIRYDDKIFTDWDMRDELVLVDFKTAGNVMATPDEWLNGFRVADRKDGTYYFMSYQREGEVHREGTYSYMEWHEGDSIHYFGPASTKEEAQRISDIWVQVFRGN